MDQGTKFLAFASVIIIAVILQVALIVSESNETPAKTAIEFTEAYFKLDRSMEQYLCNELVEDEEADVVGDYLYQVAIFIVLVFQPLNAPDLIFVFLPFFHLDG